MLLSDLQLSLGNEFFVIVFMNLLLGFIIK